MTRAATALALLLAATAARAETVDSPVYRSWARVPVGTSVTHRSVTVQGGARIETVTTSTLVGLTDERAEVESVVVSDATGRRVENPPQKLVYRRAFVLLPGVKKEDVGKPGGATAHGDESVTLAGKTFRATWYDTTSRTEAGESLTRTWMSDDVPGKLLKSVTRVPRADKETTLELTGFKTP